MTLRNGAATFPHTNAFRFEKCIMICSWQRRPNVNGHGHLGVAEAIYILGKTAGLRD